ncbi:MAG: SET domain-containing protein-lysine N-methyltransferase [Chitinophagaceae bacterium]
MQTQAGSAYIQVSDHGITSVCQRISDGQFALLTLRSWVAGEIVTRFSAAAYSTEPTYLTIQLEKGVHIALDPGYLQYTNHSCEPNVFFDTAAMNLVAIRDISAGEELTFFYPSTEWRMKQPFRCNCNSPQCLGQIKGARFLSIEIQEKYRFTPFILHQFSKRKRTTRKVA